MIKKIYKETLNFCRCQFLHSIQIQYFIVASSFSKIMFAKKKTQGRLLREVVDMNVKGCRRN